MNFKEIIIDQRKELEDIEKQERLIDREALVHAREYIKYPNLLVVMGIRRCGKSIFAYQISKGERSGYFNFDDERLAKIGSEDLNGVLKALYTVHGDLDMIILDEVQNIEGWELFANRLRRTKRVVITGSNSQVLEGNLATKLMGRYVDVTLFPFSFKEFLQSKGVDVQPINGTREQGEIMNILSEYMENGGLPEVKKMGHTIIPLVYNNILAKDIISKYGIKKKENFRQLAKYLISNHSTEITYRGLGKTVDIDRDSTISNWVNHLREAYLIFTLERFDFKLKQQFRAPKKVYCVDTGIINSVGFQPGPNNGRLMENLVAVQLQRQKVADRALEIYYWKDHAQHEVDFVLKRAEAVERLIQVTYAERRDDIRGRELDSLALAAKHLRCDDLLVITWDYEGSETRNGKRINFKPLWKWLLGAE